MCFLSVLKSVLLCLLFEVTFFIGATQHIVILMGPSSSGKSCLGDELAQYEGWCKIEKDAICYQELPKLFARVSPESYKKIRKVIDEKNILHAVIKEQYCFKDDVSDSAKKEALKAVSDIKSRLDHGPDSEKFAEKFHTRLTKLIFDEVDTAICRGESILLDVWGQKSFFTILREKYSKKSIIKRVLLHYPITRSYVAFQKRNQIAQDTKDLRGLRFWRSWIETNDMYYVFSKEKKANYLSFISRNDLENILHDVRKRVVQKREGRKRFLFSSKEMDLLDFEHYERTWLSGKENDTDIFLYAKQEYDLIMLNNDSPANLARKVKEYADKNF